MQPRSSRTFEVALIVSALLLLLGATAFLAKQHRTHPPGRLVAQQFPAEAYR